MNRAIFNVTIIVAGVMLTSVLVVGGFIVVTAAMAPHERQTVVAEPEKGVEDVVVVNETSTTLTVIFIGENGNRGTNVPPRLAVTMRVDPERDTLEVKAIGYRKDGSVAGIANHVFHLKSTKETGWWKVNQWDL